MGWKFGQLRWLSYWNRGVGERERRARPEASGRTGRAVSGRSLLVSDQRCKERERGDATQQAPIITQVRIKSSLELLSVHFVSKTFWAP